MYYYILIKRCCMSFSRWKFFVQKCIFSCKDFSEIYFNTIFQAIWWISRFRFQSVPGNLFFCEMFCKTFNGNGFHLFGLNIQWWSARLFCKQYSFSIQPQCCLTFQWSEPQMLPKCCLVLNSLLRNVAKWSDFKSSKVLS